MCAGVHVHGVQVCGERGCRGRGCTGGRPGVQGCPGVRPAGVPMSGGCTDYGAGARAGVQVCRPRGACMRGGPGVSVRRLGMRECGCADVRVYCVRVCRCAGLVCGVCGCARARKVAGRGVGRERGCRAGAELLFSPPAYRSISHLQWSTSIMFYI
jgi:hypothetical protein